MKDNGSIFDSITLVYTLAGVVFVVAMILVGWFWYGYYGTQKTSSRQIIVNTISVSSTATSTNFQQCQYRRLLDGVCVDSKEATHPQIVAVMVENHFQSWPQAGIANASVVYEAPVEANITRFLLIFPRGIKVDKLGPIRSARPYFLDWVQEYGEPMYMHVGGSPEALADISTRKIFDMNEFYFGGVYFWRSTDRTAPHNTYTSSKMWEVALNKKIPPIANTTTTFPAWTFGSYTPCVFSSSTTSTDCAKNITIAFAPPTYETVWKFNSSTQQYRRYEAGNKDTDQDGTPMVADTVIIQHVNTTVVDTDGRLHMNDVGSGDAVVFRNGAVIKGTWKKTSISGRTEWLDKKGNFIPLKSGKIWIEVVNQQTKVSWQ